MIFAKARSGLPERSHSGMRGLRTARTWWLRLILPLAIGTVSPVASAQLAWLDGVPLEKRQIALQSLVRMIEEQGGESTYLERLKNGLIPTAADHISKSPENHSDCEHDAECTADRNKHFDLVLGLTSQPRAAIDDKWLHNHLCEGKNCVAAITRLKPASAADRRYLVGVQFVDQGF
jgi:hypothetical protein